jgi:primosomal protein N' (replication factor Y)
MPIVKGINQEELTYFSTQPIATGSIISVPLRNKTVKAIVTSSKDARQEKASLRSSAFMLKKIESVKPVHFLLPTFVQAIREAAQYHASTTGSALELFVPTLILEKSPEYIPAVKKHPSHFEVSVLQTDTEERFAHYKSLIRESFANNQSVYIILPTQESVDIAASNLTKGIEDYAFVFHGGIGKTKILKDWTRAVKEEHPIVLIGTPQFLSLPRNDISHIVLEEEHSPQYIFQSRPFIDARFVAERFAKHNECELILGDTLLRIETLKRVADGDVVEVTPLKYRSLSKAASLLIDMTAEKKKEEDGSPILSKTLIQVLHSSLEQNERVLLFAARKGLGSITICGDCEHVVQGSAGVPMVLYSHPDGNIFVCPQTGETKNAKMVCENCGSWKLVPLGIGTERVEEEVKKLFPKRVVIRFDAETAPTKKKARELIEKFYSKPSSIIICTEKALPYVTEPVEHVAVASIDSFFAIPDYRMSEKVVHILLALRSKATESFVIQTRQATQTVFDHVIQGNLLAYFREELAIREALNYPPRSVLIKVSRSGTPFVVERDIKVLEELLKDYNPVFYPSLSSKRKSHSTTNALIKLERERWIEATLQKHLMSLPPSYVVEINPRTIL